MNSVSLSPTPKKTVLKHPVDHSGNPVLLDRDHSLVAFNERVFSWAERQDVPVLERLRYLCIVSSNLDEFFEVRADPHITASKGNVRNGAYYTRGTVSYFAPRGDAPRVRVT